MARSGAIARIAVWAIFANNGPLMGVAVGSSPGARSVYTTAWHWCFAILVITDLEPSGRPKRFALNLTI
jgi:hypothetical protein